MEPVINPSEDVPGALNAEADPGKGVMGFWINSGNQFGLKVLYVGSGSGQFIYDSNNPLQLLHNIEGQDNLPATKITLKKNVNADKPMDEQSAKEIVDYINILMSSYKLKI